MSTFKLEIELDNDAFLDNKIEEIKRILCQAMRKLENTDKTENTFRLLRDINGNSVGTMRIEEN